MQLRVVSLAVLCAVFTAACGSSSSSSSTSSDTGNTVTCDSDAQVVAYAPGMQQMGDSNNFIFELVKSDPGLAEQTPITWTMQVLDANTKQPISGATLQLKPFMPTMGHGSSQTPQISASGDTYTVSNIYLFMAGLWSFTVTATANNESDSAIFYFCVDG